MEPYYGRRTLTKIALTTLGTVSILGLSGCGCGSDTINDNTKNITNNNYSTISPSSSPSYNKLWTEPTDTPPHPRGYDPEFGDNNKKLKQNLNQGYCPPKIQPKKCPPPPKCVRNRGYGRN